MPIASLIVKIGADLADLRENVKKSTDILGNMQSVIGTVGKALVGAFAVERVLGMAGAVLDFAGNMTDLAARTGMSTDALQVFTYAGAQVGVSVNSIVSAVSALQDRLAGGDKSALSALKDLGIGFDDIRAKAPDEQMALIAAAIAKIPDPAERTRVAMDLMGKGAAEIMPLLLSDFGEMAAKARELGLVIGSDTIAAMDDLGDTWSALKAVGMGVIADVLQPFVPWIKEAAQGALDAAAGFRSWTGAWSTAMEQWKGEAAGWMASFRSWVAEQLEAANSTGAYTDAIRANRDAAVWWDGVHKGLTTTQTAATAATREATEAVRQNAAAQAEAAKHAREIQQITDRLYGADVIEKARNYAEAIEAAGGKLPPMKDAQAEVNKVMTEALAIMEQTGQGATAMAARLDALRLQSLQPLAATHLDVSKMMAAVPQAIKPESVPEILAQKLADDAAEYFAEQDKFYADLAKDVAAMTPTIEKPISESTERMTQKWHALGAAAQSALRAMVPEEFSFSKAYSEAGMIVHGSIGGLAAAKQYRGFQFGTQGYENFGAGTPVMLHGYEKVTPFGRGGDGVVISTHVDARESSYDSPAGVQRLADKVSAAIVARLRAQGASL